MEHKKGTNKNTSQMIKSIDTNKTKSPELKHEELESYKKEIMNEVNVRLEKERTSNKLPINNWFLMLIGAVAFLFWYYITEKDIDLQRQIQNLEKDFKLHINK